LELKRFFFRHFKVIAIVASLAEPWFQDAAVNTVFTILERCEDAAARNANITRFVKVKRPLADILPQELLMQENDRWNKVDALVRQVRDADASAMDLDALARGDATFTGVRTVENDDFRIRLVSQAELRAEAETRGEQAKWGKYLRAPQVCFDLQKELGDKLVPLTTVADVRRGYTTGINDFFLLEVLGKGEKAGTLRVRSGRGYEIDIEEICLHPIISSPKEAQEIDVNLESLPYRLFLPPLKLDDEKKARNPKKLLLEMGWIGAHKYVEWGEKQNTQPEENKKSRSSGVPWPKVPTVSNRKAWWFLRATTHADAFWPKAFNTRFAVFANECNALALDRLYELDIKEELDKQLTLALLNSTVLALATEVNGRVNLGEGALDNMAYEAETCLVPNPAAFTDKSRKKILSAFDKLKKRAVKPIAEEVKQTDRRALDEAVLTALGLDPDAYLKQIYAGLVEMVNERLTLPKMRRKQKKQVARVSQEQVESQVRNEILPNGVKSIAAFLPKPKPKMTNVSVTGRPVSWQPFISEFTLLDTDGKAVGTLTGTEIQAQYAVYAAKPMEFSISLPETFAASKAVQAYEEYLCETGKQLRNRAVEATRDVMQAEQLAREILQSFGLPEMAVEAAMGG